MKPRFFIIGITIIMMPYMIFSQNIFPNGDFESKDSCPYDMGQIKFCKFMDNASGSVDFFNCGYAGSVVTTFPGSGTGYLSMLGGKMAAPNWIFYSENMKTRLITPIQKGKNYLVRFKAGYDVISEPDSLLDFGFHFYSKPLPSKLSVDLGCRSNIKPQVRVNANQLIKNNYRDFNFCFYAEDNYDSVMIGPFCNEYSANMLNSPISNWYFMLDDIEIIVQDPSDFTSDKTVLCDSGFVNFSVVGLVPIFQYLWKFPGAEPDSSPNYAIKPIFYNKPGKYQVSLITFGYCQDTTVKNNYIEVIASSSNLNLLEDSLGIICHADSFQINTVNNRIVNWSNGVKSSYLKVLKNGVYTCKFFTGCDTAYDTIRIQFVPRKSFSADKLQICDSGNVNFTVLNSSLGDNYFWTFSGALPTSSFLKDPKDVIYKNEGTHSVRLIIDGLCKDTIQKQNVIQVTKRLKDPDLIQDIELSKCYYESIPIKAKNNITVQWSTGVTANEILALDQGKYYCTYSTFCETITDSVFVRNREECPCEAMVPNAFSPNGDTKNDFFMMNGYADNVEISVYNRVGEKMFFSTDPKFQWDGRYKDKIVPIGAYIYLLNYTNCLKTKRSKNGWIQVIR